MSRRHKRRQNPLGQGVISVSGNDIETRYADGRRKVSSDMILGGVLHGYAFCKDCIGIDDSFDEYEIAGAVPVLEGDIGIELMECATCSCYLES